MKQLITRMDDELHARLKARAAATNRSLNDLVIESLTNTLAAGGTRQAVRDRMRALHLLVAPEQPAHAPTPDAVREGAGEGAGAAVLAALWEERVAR